MTYSHMGEPHYHRRWSVSRLSSGWDQVVPDRYGRQAKRMITGKDEIKRDIDFFGAWRLPCSCVIRNCLGCYIAKPHEQLVLVSSTPRSAYTPSLSTSWSSTALQEAQGLREISSWKGLPA